MAEVSADQKPPVVLKANQGMELAPKDPVDPESVDNDPGFKNAQRKVLSQQPNVVGMSGNTKKSKS